MAPICWRSGCCKPTYNGQSGEYCSRYCRSIDLGTCRSQAEQYEQEQTKALKNEGGTVPLQELREAVEECQRSFRAEVGAGRRKLEAEQQRHRQRDEEQEAEQVRRRAALEEAVREGRWDLPWQRRTQRTQAAPPAKLQGDGEGPAYSQGTQALCFVPPERGALNPPERGWGPKARLMKARPSLCLRSGCGKPSWNGKPGGYCSKICRESRSISNCVSARGFAGQPGSPVLCIRVGCTRHAFEGKRGNFCGKSCQQKGPASWRANEVPDPLPAPEDGSPFVAWHGTSMANARAIQEGKFRPSTGGNLGVGIYFGGARKASRFAHDFHQSAPALVKARIVVRSPKCVAGDDETWQQEGCYDSCYAERTTRSSGPEWCILDPSQITVLEIMDLKGRARPEL